MRKFLGLVTALVLTGLVVMTAARFVGTDVRALILIASFSSYAVLGFVVVLLGCALAFRGARRRRWVVLLAVVSGLGLVVQGLALAPLYAGGSAGRPDLTVMTANLEFGRGDAVTVVRTVASEKVDVLVLEEVNPRALNSLRTAGLAELLPHQLGEARWDASGTMVFSRYPLDTPRPFRLGNTGLDVRVRAPQPFRLLAVHAAQPVGWPKPWANDMRAVLQRSASTVDQGSTIVAGDFNATRDHEQLRAILDTGLRDAAEEAGSGWQPTWPSRYREGWYRPVIAIDHVLTSRQYEAISTSTVEVARTDHLALVVQLRLR